jgi:hypothetical protein
MDAAWDLFRIWYNIVTNTAQVCLLFWAVTLLWKLIDKLEEIHRDVMELYHDEKEKLPPLPRWYSDHEQEEET